MESLDILNIILLLLFCAVLLYVNSTIKEGFATPVDQNYDFHEVFKPFPLNQVCQIYKDVYDGMFKLEKIDLNGGPVPDDIAKKNTTITIKQKAGGAVLSCPFAFPDGTDINKVHKFVTRLPPQTLVNGYRTLLFCKKQLTDAVENGKKSLADIPPKAKEGFFDAGDAIMTECSAEELAERKTIPLQCIDPENERGDQQDALKDADPQELLTVTQKKKEITKSLKTILVTLNMIYPKGHDYAEVIADCKKLKKELNDLQQKAQTF